MTLKLTSTAFAHEGAIPKIHTCEGQEASPPLAWSGVPANAKSLVLIVDDPDAPDPAAPEMTWVHWVLYNIVPAATGLPQGVSPKELPASTLQGVSDFNRSGSSARGRRASRATRCRGRGRATGIREITGRYSMRISFPTAVKTSSLRAIRVADKPARQIKRNSAAACLNRGSPRKPSA